MNKFSLFLVLFFSTLTFYGQQLNCKVTVNAQKVSNADLQVYKTLETSLNEFVNKTDWNGQVLKQNEKINCSMFITINSFSSDNYVATIQVQSSRLILNSTYTSPVFNYNDKDFSFRYTEFENLIFNPNTFDSNLVSIMAYYSYLILGVDADTFMPLAGTPFLETARNVANVAQQGGYKGWSQGDGLQNRFFLINDLLSPSLVEARNTVFGYHQGLDLMSEDLKKAKEKIKGSLLNLTKVASVRPNAFLTRLFFDAKSDEIVAIFSGGPSITISDLVDSLNKTSPLNSSKWVLIKY